MYVFYVMAFFGTLITGLLMSLVSGGNLTSISSESLALSEKMIVIQHSVVGQSKATPFEAGVINSNDIVIPGGITWDHVVTATDGDSVVVTYLDREKYNLRRYVAANLGKSEKVSKFPPVWGSSMSVGIVVDTDGGYGVEIIGRVPGNIFMLPEDTINPDIKIGAPALVTIFKKQE